MTGEHRLLTRRSEPLWDVLETSVVVAESNVLFLVQYALL